MTIVVYDVDCQTRSYTSFDSMEFIQRAIEYHRKDAHTSALLDIGFR